MMIFAALKKRLKYFDLDVSLSCLPGRMTVMIGPSGGGKTTIIRMLAGLQSPDEGRVVFGDEIWFDSDCGINVKPQKRRLGYVFQDYNLFPHLNLFDNAAFAAVDKKEVDGLFDLFKIGHLKKRKPHLVSGGERQRCAICQALARHPRLLLLDEPFSALDVVTRRGLREELKSLKGNLACPVIYVTHDINEALFLADEILPVVDGKKDPGWMQRTITREPKEGMTARGAREPRLALVY
ncbi:MAG: ATP-binding cassette domain-containing protein [Smithellaceae bacterium]|nr:ATP-binding cassette domain-containing protein [Syntrophaceae bacterium]MDD4240014.1 ATP-binding cassette domain-containing protein [Smithellaceae bacterium]NLX53431.1 ATP-binding cassette domain-containing protein [Deltaproteobacteria bacterium]